MVSFSVGERKEHKSSKNWAAWRLDLTVVALRSDRTAPLLYGYRSPQIRVR